MPPAFNLSQDQTLKFNPQHSLKADMSAQSLRYSTTQRAALSQQTKHPHLSIVQIFKEPLKKKAPSAQKRNCHKNSQPRQHLKTKSQTPERKKTYPAPKRTANYRQQKYTVNGVRAVFEDQYSAPPAKFSNRVYSPRNVILTVPVGPFRCLPMISSAEPLSAESGL